MNFRKILIMCLLCAVFGVRGEDEAQTIKLPDEIVQAFVGGDARTISKYFNSSVELILSERGGVYAKAQAEQILKNFFNDNALSNRRFNYKELHSSTRDNPQSFIGELHTGKGIYRVTIYMKDQLIHLMRIESND